MTATKCPYFIHQLDLSPDHYVMLVYKYDLKKAVGFAIPDRDDNMRIMRPSESDNVKFNKRLKINQTRTQIHINMVGNWTISELTQCSERSFRIENHIHSEHQYGDSAVYRDWCGLERTTDRPEQLLTVLDEIAPPTGLQPLNPPPLPPQMQLIGIVPMEHRPFHKPEFDKIYDEIVKCVVTAHKVHVHDDADFPTVLENVKTGLKDITESIITTFLDRNITTTNATRDYDIYKVLSFAMILCYLTMDNKGFVKVFKQKCKMTDDAMQNAELIRNANFIIRIIYVSFPTANHTDLSTIFYAISRNIAIMSGFVGGNRRSKNRKIKIKTIQRKRRTIRASFRVKGVKRKRRANHM